MSILGSGFKCEAMSLIRGYGGKATIFWVGEISLPYLATNQNTQNPQN